MEIIPFIVGFVAGGVAMAIYNQYKPDKVNKLAREILEELGKGKQLAGDVKAKLKEEVDGNAAR